MRILIVAPNIRVPGTNGGSTHVTEILRALGTRHDVAVLARHGSRGPGVLPIRHLALPPGLDRLKPFLQFPAALSYARRFRPDVVYERNSALGLGVLLGRVLGVPSATLVMDANVSAVSWRADAFVTVTLDLVPDARRRKAHSVCWGANVAHFHPDVDGSAVRHRFGVQPDEILIAYTGGFYGWHGLDVLVDAAHQLASSAAPLRLRYLLVGDGECRPAIMKRIGDLHLRSSFLLPGRIPYAEVPQYVAACDIAVAPYQPTRPNAVAGRRPFFGDPLKVFEYLAAGRATVAADSPNMRRLFVGDRDLVFAAPGDSGALARALERLAGDPARRRRLGAAGRATVAERYSWDRHGRELGDIFERLVEAQH